MSWLRWLHMGMHLENPPRNGAPWSHTHWHLADPVTGNSCSRGPRHTGTAVEGTVEDSEGHHLTQGPPDGHCTVRPRWASHVNGSCWLKVLPATGAWKGSGSFQVGYPQQGRAGGFPGWGRRLGAGAAGVLLGPAGSSLRQGGGCMGQSITTQGRQPPLTCQQEGGSVYSGSHRWGF